MLLLGLGGMRWAEDCCWRDVGGGRGVGPLRAGVVVVIVVEWQGSGRVGGLVVVSESSRKSFGFRLRSFWETLCSFPATCMKSFLLEILSCDQILHSDFCLL